MNRNPDNMKDRLERLGRQLAEQPSVVEEVMGQIDRGRAPPIPVTTRRRILTMLSKPRNLLAAAAVLALVVFGLRPWASNPENGRAAWWLSPPSVWAGELQAAVDRASLNGYACREQIVNIFKDGKRATSSTTNRFFTAGNRYRRDIYDEGRLRESQWYVQAPDGLTMTSVRYNDKTYAVTHDPKAQGEEEELDTMKRIEKLAGLVSESGRRIATARVEGRDAVEFEIDASKVDPDNVPPDETLHVWLDQATRMPLKITCEFQEGGLLAGTILVMDHFDWNTTLPAGTFEPEIPKGFTERQSD